MAQTPRGVLTPPGTPPQVDDPVMDGGVPVCDHPHNWTEWREMVNICVDLSVREVFDLVYVGSRFLVKFLEDRKTSDITFGALETLGDGTRRRISTFTVVLGPGGPAATARMVQVETWRPSANVEAGLHSVDVEIFSKGLPFSESFCALVHVCGRKSGLGGTDFGVWAKMHYKKTVWKIARMPIEAIVWRMLDTYYAGLKPALEQAEKMSPEVREGWKTVLFPLEATAPCKAPPPLTPPVAPGGPVTSTLSPPPRSDKGRGGGALRHVPSASGAPAALGSSLPVPHWWVLTILVALTWMNAFLVARILFPGPDGVPDAVALGPVAPYLSRQATPPYPSDFAGSAVLEFDLFLAGERQSRQLRVASLRRLAYNADLRLREAELSLESFEIEVFGIESSAHYFSGRNLCRGGEHLCEEEGIS